MNLNPPFDQPPTGGSAPEFIRLPKRGPCPYSGLSRAKLNQLILRCPANGFRPQVKSISLRRPGAMRGARLIVLSSLIAYLHSLVETSEDDGRCTS